MNRKCISRCRITLGNRTRQRGLLILVSVVSLVLTPLTGGIADQLFHSVRLSLELTPDGALNGHPALRNGHVVDIHPNGPINGAHERYELSGAKPNTTYQVLLRVFDNNCSGLADKDLDPLPTVTLTTNRQGNASGKFEFPAGPPQPSPVFFGVRWTLVSNNVVAYETDCITVGLD